MKKDIQELRIKIQELEGRIVQLENLTVLGEETYTPPQQVRVSGVPYKVDRKDLEK